jgi:hypothetical protein
VRDTESVGENVSGLLGTGKRGGLIMGAYNVNPEQDMLWLESYRDRLDDLTDAESGGVLVNSLDTLHRYILAYKHESREVEKYRQAVGRGMYCGNCGHVVNDSACYYAATGGTTVHPTHVCDKWTAKDA